MILTGCVAFAEHVGPTRVESELLPQCWEQVGTLIITTTVVHHCIGCIGILYWRLSRTVLNLHTILYKPFFIGLCISLGVGQCEHTIYTRICASCNRLLVQTRMHSSRMRTVRNSSRLLGVLTESQTRVKT